PSDDDYYDVSFSGLKTSVLTRVRALEAEGRLERETANVAASFQTAVVDVLATKTMRPVKETGCSRVVLGGGVAASRALRDALRGALGTGGAPRARSLRRATVSPARLPRAGHGHFEPGVRPRRDVAARADRPFRVLRRRAEVAC